MLQPIDKISGKLIEQLPAPVTCEACGKIVPVRDLALNVMHVTTIGSPGHPGVPPFQCPAIEHWACSVECWRLVAHACIDEHMHPTLLAVHERLNNVNSSDTL